MMQGRARQDPRHLLDTQADQNIGNGSIIQPQSGPATVIPQTNPERILMLSGPSNTGQTTSITLTAARIVGPNNPSPGLPGPITGIIEFGNGGQFTRVEVDIPIGPFAGLFIQAAQGTEPQDGGVIVTVPTGVLRVYARYDNQFIQPALGTPTLSLAQIQGASFVGPGGPRTKTLPFGVQATFPPEPILTKAMAAYFSRHTSRVYRTQYLYVADPTTGVLTRVLVSGAQGVPNVAVIYCVPPFARYLRILRSPQVALNVTTCDSSQNPLESYSLNAGTPSPTIPIAGTETIIELASPKLTDTVFMLALSYEIGI